MTLATSFLFPVVGVTFVDAYPGNLHALAEAVDYTNARDESDGAEPLIVGEGPTALLRRNPANAYDANAIEVHVPSVGQIGHVPKELAARLAPEIDGGALYLASLVAVTIHPQHPDRPGAWVRANRLGGAS